MVEVSKPEEMAGVPAGKGSKTAAAKPQVELPHSLAVRELAELLKTTPVELIKRLMRRGIMANINQVVDYETAAALAAEFGYEACPKPGAARRIGAIAELKKQQRQAAEVGLKPRPPIVTIMGHVDHGKTRLLDAIRQTHVMESEAGGITQHIGAYQVEVDGHKVTFLDTPGHEAFTAMRARGAQITDIAVLVVAADDGVMPQTLEAIDHARAAGVPIIVALNKMDKPEANPDRVKQQLADAGLVVEGWGGDIIAVPVSARAKTGISQLLESILLVAEMEELKANPAVPAVGVVVESKLDKTRGPLATVLVHDGTLRVGDIVVVGTTLGRVRAMFNEAGKQVRKAEPATPVEISGLNRIPQVGDTLNAVANERQAQALVEKRQKEMQKETAARAGVRLSNLYEQISAGRVKELNVILKTDVQGSIEPIKNSLERLSTDQVQVRVIRSASGSITENDVLLASASQGLIMGFSTTVEPGAKRLAETEGVDIRIYNIIYDLLDNVGKALKGMLEPTFTEVVEGRAEVVAIFPVGKKSKVAGVKVTEGKAVRNALVRVRRKGEVVAESTVSSLKRFKEDVKEVAAGYECGVGVENFSDFQVGDILEFFRVEKTY